MNTEEFEKGLQKLSKAELILRLKIVFNGAYFVNTSLPNIGYDSYKSNLAKMEALSDVLNESIWNG